MSKRDFKSLRPKKKAPSPSQGRVLSITTQTQGKGGKEMKKSLVIKRHRKVCHIDGEPDRRDRMYGGKDQKNQGRGALSYPGIRTARRRVKRPSERQKNLWSTAWLNETGERTKKWNG